MTLTDVRHWAGARVRRSLERAVRRPAFRNAAQRVIAELDHALNDPSASGIYGSRYFGSDRDSMDRMGLSGYERYDRDTSNANAAAYMAWRFLPGNRVLDVGCAAGFVVEALRELGLDAWGTDISHYALEHPANGAQGRLQWGDLMQGLPYPEGHFEIVTCLETLEHMRPDSIPTVLRELRRVTSKYLICTIPSFGRNDWGPNGWYQVKVRDELLDDYYSRGDDYEGPVPYDDLYLDANGQPIEGHLTIASFRWWTKQFEAAGFRRCGMTELRIHPHLARFGLTKYWNLYVLRTPDAPEPEGDVRSASEIEHWEQNFKLSGREPLPEDRDAVEKALAEHDIHLDLTEPTSARSTAASPRSHP